MAEDKRKHLEFIQNVITRMGTNSFLIKGWSITLVSALFALAAKDAHGKFVLITFFAVPVFWALDAYYLSLERQFRRVYFEVAEKNEEEIDFIMNPQDYNSGSNTWQSCLVRNAVWPLYTIILLIALCVIFFINNQ